MGMAVGNLGRWIREDPLRRCILVYEDEHEMVLCFATVQGEGPSISATPLALLIDPLDMSRMGQKKPKDTVMLFQKDLEDFDLKLFSPLKTA